MPWAFVVVGYDHPLGYAYCVEHSDPATRGRPIREDQHPPARCDHPQCGVVLGGNRAAKRSVYVKD